MDENVRMTPGQRAQLDQITADVSATLDGVIAMHRERDPGAGDLAIVGLTAAILIEAEQEERGFEWLAQLLAVAVDRLA